MVIKNKCVSLHFQNQQNYDNKKGHTNTIPIVAGNGRNAAVKYMVFGQKQL